jgi:hypothetical protein
MTGCRQGTFGLRCCCCISVLFTFYTKRSKIGERSDIKMPPDSKCCLKWCHWRHLAAAIHTSGVNAAEGFVILFYRRFRVDAREVKIEFSLNFEPDLRQT